MPKISDERKTERREQILEGARRCFAEHGYEGATVVRLEREIGLSRGAIFNYFPSKEELFIELAVRDNARMSEVWISDGLATVVRAVVELDPAWLSSCSGACATTRPSARVSRSGRRRSLRRTVLASRKPSGTASSATTSPRRSSARS